jgi:hypothetical protein
MLKADEIYFADHGEPLFSSHMLDLSEEPLEVRVHCCACHSWLKIYILMMMSLHLISYDDVVTSDLLRPFYCICADVCMLSLSVSNCTLSYLCLTYVTSVFLVLIGKHTDLCEVHGADGKD